MNDQYSDNERIEIANNIIRQLGGHGKLKSLIAITDILARDAGIQFKFSGSKKMNKCIIDLELNDTYTVKFYKIPHLNMNAKSLDSYFKELDLCKIPIYECDNIYADMLINLFEKRTGLFIRL